MSNWFKNLFSPPEKTAPGDNSRDLGKKPPTQLAPAGESVTHKEQGDAHLGKGDLEEAKACYRRAIALNPDYAKAYSNLGFVLNEQGRHDEAEHCLKTALSIDPKIADAHYMLGAISRLQGKLEDAISHFRKALELDPELEFAYRDLCYALFQHGNIEDAKEVITRGLAHYPGLPDFHYFLGNLHKHTGKLDKATACYRTALTIQPAYVEVHYNLGLTLQELGHLSEAEASYRRILEIKPDFAEVHSNLGLTLQELGRLDEAEATYRQALQFKPDFAEAHSNLGITLHNQGRLDEAVASYRRALEIKADFAEAHYNFGITLKELGSPDEAEASYRRALEIKLDFAGAHSNLGLTLQELGRLDEAEASCRQALQIKPDFAEAHSNLGITLHNLGRLDEAVASYLQALQIKPDSAEVHNNMGLTLHHLGRLDEAEASCRRALKIKPDFAEAHLNLGNVLKDMGRLAEAEASYLRALQTKPDFAEAYNNLGNALEDLGKLDDAVASYRRALQVKPDYAEAHSNLLFSLNYSSSFAPSYCLAEARQYGQAVGDKVTSRFAEWPCVKQPERLRIGLVSGDFRNHPAGYFLQNLLANLDPASVELIAYPTDPKADELTARIKPHFSAWKPLYGQSDEAAARLIHSDSIHVLLDLSGHTAHNRLPIFAWKPAPVQASWLGYFATTGVAAIDYLIADPWTLPETEEVYFTEKIWRLPETRLCFTLPDADVEVSPLPSLSNGHITFGCFNNLAKMNDDVVALWARIIRYVPGSCLFLKAGQLKEALVRQNTINRFAAHGIAPDRLILEGSESRKKYFAAYHRVDIALDPFPYPGGTTSIEGLWMGVPVLTLAGERFLSRQGVGLLMNAGLPEWIASNADDYIARAKSHVGDLQRLAALRNGLRQQVIASPLFNAARFARHFEEAMWGMWEQSSLTDKKQINYQKISGSPENNPTPANAANTPLRP